MVVVVMGVVIVMGVVDVFGVWRHGVHGRCFRHSSLEDPWHGRFHRLLAHGSCELVWYGLFHAVKWRGHSCRSWWVDVLFPSPPRPVVVWCCWLCWRQRCFAEGHGL